MHNPLYLFTAEVIEELLRLGHTHFVRQTYKRGIDHTNTDQKGAFLISHYLEEGYASIHFDAIVHDKVRFLYDISNPEHLAKLRSAAQQPDGYAIYTLHLATEKWRVPDDMKGKVKRYITMRLNWKPGRDDGVKASLFSQYGDLYIALKWKNHEVKVPLGDIERL